MNHERGGRRGNFVSRRAAFRWPALAAAIVFVARESRTQINIEPMRAQLLKRGMLTVLQSSVSATQGNMNSLQLGGAGLFGFGDSRNFFFITGSSSYARFNGVPTISKGFMQTRYGRSLTRRVWVELYSFSESDRFRYLRLRVKNGFGPRFEILEGEISLAYGVSYLLELTKRSNGVEGSWQRIGNHRCNNYVALSYRPQSNVVLTEVVYFQPRFDLLRDYWLIGEFTARFQVTPLLSSNVDLTVYREAEVPPRVKNADLTLVTSLAITL